MNAVTWPRRPRVANTIAGRRSIWLSKCRRYEVSRGLDYAPGQFLAIARAVIDCHGTHCGPRILGRHRTLAAAQSRCELHCKLNTRN